MWAAALLALAFVGGAPAPAPAAPRNGPDAALLAVAVDQADLAAADPQAIHRTLPFLRYLDLGPTPEPDRADLLDALSFWANSLSLERNFAPLTPVDGGRLVRLDLRAFGWDRRARAARIARLEKRGVAFKFKDRRRFEDIWEELVVDGREPYFQVNQVDAKGRLVEGWLDPVVEAEVRRLSHSALPVVRADWFLAKTAWDKGVLGFAGFYSDFLLIPPEEGDLFTALGIDRKLAEDELQVRGGASLSRGVALHNRELQRFPGFLGHDLTFLWRSLDVANEGAGKNVLEDFAGSLKRDGSEHIFSLPNGLHGYYACDGKGSQVGEVPANIAQDRGARHDTRVINAYKCVTCHGPQDGINVFKDVVADVATGREVALAAIAKDPDRVDELTRKLEAYYFSPLGDLVAQEQDSYAARIEALVGRKGGDNAANFTHWVEDHVFGRVERPRAARELGVAEAELVPLLKRSGEPLLLALAAGTPLSRESWERAYAAAARTLDQPWRQPVDSAPHPGPHP